MARYKESDRKKFLNDARQALLAAAAEEMAQHGYENANINRISTTAGYAKGTVYNYFPSKHALLLALIEDVAKGHYLFIERRVSQVAQADGRILRFFEAGFAYVASQPARCRVVLNTIYGPDSDAKTAAYQAYQPLFQLVGEQILGQGIAQGLFRGVDPATTANLIMTIYLGSASQVNEEGIPYMDPQQVASFVLQALAAGKA